MTRKFVFISGPYSIGDVGQNVAEAIRAGDLIAEAGHIPFIPHLCHFWHMICPHEYEFWLDQDIQWLEKCDVLVRLEGESAGADKEVARAEALDIPVFFSVNEFLRSEALLYMPAFAAPDYWMPAPPTLTTPAVTQDPPAGAITAGPGTGGTTQAVAITPDE